MFIMFIKKQFIIYKCPYCPYKNVYASLGAKQYCLSESPVVLGAEGTGTSTLYNFHGIEVNFASMTCISSSSNSPLWVRGCRIGPTYPPACRKRRLIGGSLFAVGCDPCQWKRGSWLLSQCFVAALRRQYTALASISLSRKVKMAWLNQSAGSAKP